MLFNSFQFALFLSIVFAIHYLTPSRWRWLILLVGSYFFYACWRWEYLFLLVGVTVVHWFCSLQIEASSDRWTRRLYLGVALAASLGVLFFFKYYNFAQESLSSLVRALGGAANFPVLQIVLPVALSFYTFQVMSYTLDVYFGKVKPEGHFGHLALFVAFFPKLVAGPIDRVGNLLAAYFFTFQIYCDFSGYMDIAIGSARILGYDLVPNFLLPYFAASITDFWRRWHISLSTWFRDYLYIPLGGNCVESRSRWIAVILSYLRSAAFGMGLPGLL